MLTVVRSSALKTGIQSTITGEIQNFQVLYCQDPDLAKTSSLLDFKRLNFYILFQG